MHRIVIEAINPLKRRKMSIHGTILFQEFSSFFDSKSFKAFPKYFDRTSITRQCISDCRRERKAACQEEIDPV
jgi:hypothetical protein